MDRRFMGILAGIVIIFAVIFVFTKHSNTTNTGHSSGGQTTNHVEGQNQKNVTLVEYGDYECPVCYLYYQPVKQAVADNLSDIKFQFRNLPLTSIHPNAFAGARAAEAAGLQGKYWEMHDLLYENQDPNGSSGWVASSNPLNFFSDFAKQLGLNVDQFKSDYGSSKVNSAINADRDQFAKTGQAQATPTFFLNGKYLPNSELIDSKTGQPTAAKITAAIKTAETKK